jgi:hypothetical protein
MTSRAARFAAAFASLYAAHQVADHHVQSDRDAQAKGKPGREGQAACARHVASYTATAAAALAFTEKATGAGMRPGRVAAALAVSAVSHYVIDRREPLRRFAEATGHGGFYRLGQPRPGKDDKPCLGTGAYALDQAAHVGFLWLAALIGGKR